MATPLEKQRRRLEIVFPLSRAGSIQVKRLMSLPVWTALICHITISNLIALRFVQKKSEGSLGFQDTDRHQRQMLSGQGLGRQSVSKDKTAEWSFTLTNLWFAIFLKVLSLSNQMKIKMKKRNKKLFDQIRLAY